ncbi:MAG: hypothetical protein LBH92_05990 [Bacteroidales bacterium]|jgi:hypothetical protein|nr:hypothetical protein [Bacteroidales bacterium]
MRQNKTFKIFIFLLFAISPVFSQADRDRFDSLENLADNISYSQKQKSLDIIREMYDIAHDSQDSGVFIIRTIYVESIVNERQGILDSVLLQNINIRLQTDNLTPRENLLLMLSLIHNYLTFGDHISAYATALQALEDSKQLKDSLMTAKLLHTLGSCCKNVKLYNMAEDFYLEALGWIDIHTSKNIYYSIKANLYSTYLSMNEVEDKAAIIDSIQILIEEIKEQPYQNALPLLYTNIGNYYISTDGDEQKIIYNLLKASELYKENPHRHALISYNAGVYYMFRKQDYNKAVDYFRDSRNVWEQNNEIQYLTFLYKSLMYAYIGIEQIDSALFYAQKYQEFVDKENLNAQMMETYQKYITTYLDASENKLMLAESKNALKNKQLVITLISTGGLILMAVLLFIIFWQKRRSMRQYILLKEAEAKELNMQLEKELILQQVQADQLENKKRELSSYSLLLSNKNQILNQISEVNDHLSLANVSDGKRRIEMIIRENLQVDNDWNDFVIHFEEVHPRFFEKVRELYPKVTQDDLRLMAYIRIGIAPKQIAQMLNITYGSIRISRHRLKTKLNLNKEENLDHFIQSI